MTDVRETLNEIQQRADAASRMLMTGSKPWLVRDSAIDVPRLVAAMRAVLDELDRCDTVTKEANKAPWSSVRHMPAIAEVARLRKLITEALGGDA